MKGLVASKGEVQPQHKFVGLDLPRSTKRDISSPATLTCQPCRAAVPLSFVNAIISHSSSHFPFFEALRWMP